MCPKSFVNDWTDQSALWYDYRFKLTAVTDLSIKSEYIVENDDNALTSRIFRISMKIFQNNKIRSWLLLEVNLRLSHRKPLEIDRKRYTEKDSWQVFWESASPLIQPSQVKTVLAECPLYIIQTYITYQTYITSALRLSISLSRAEEILKSSIIWCFRSSNWHNFRSSTFLIFCRRGIDSDLIVDRRIVWGFLSCLVRFVR